MTLSGVFLIVSKAQKSTAESAAAAIHKPSVIAAVATNLCTAGGEAADLVLTGSEVSFDGTEVAVSGCTFSIDGTHSFLSLDVASSGVLTQTATTGSTITRTVITVSGAVTVDATSRIDVDGKGFLAGATSNGAGGQAAFAGDRSGGSHGGVGGGQDNGAGIPPAAYGSIAQPTEPGSGGGGNSSSGAGGGAFKLTTGALTLNGIISANGSTGSRVGGAGGSLWIIGTGTVSGNGTIRANGANANFDGNNNGAGAGGRISFLYDSSQPGNGALSLVFQAFGGIQAGNNIQPSRGGAGTVYIERTNIHVAGQGNLTVANNAVVIDAMRKTPIPNAAIFADVVIKDQAVAEAEAFTAANLSILTNGRLQHDFATASVIKRLNVTVTGATTIDSTASISLDGRGMPAGRTSDGAGGMVAIGGVNAGDRSGGSHGGVGGGQDNGAGIPPAAYDSLTQPTEPGSGAGGNGGAAGGGYVKLTTGSFSMDGTITANGSVLTVAAGAGGAAWITAAGAITGAGTIRASGGNANFNGNNNGAGGGGRIAFYYNSSVGGNGSIGLVLQAFGGIQSGNNIQPSRGGAGTIYLERTNVEPAGQGSITIANNSSTTSKYTPLPNGTFLALTVKDGAYAYNNGTLTITDITLNSVGQFLAATVNVGNNFTATNSSLLTHEFTDTVTINRLTMTVTNTLSFDATSQIEANGRGFVAGRTSNGAGGQTTIPGVNNGDRSGGSHGGVGGGQDNAAGIPGAVYDSFTQPTEPGSGGGGNSSSNAGGGIVKITTAGLTFNGTLSMNGSTGTRTGGAGGAVWMIVTGAISGNGTIRANGANANYDGNNNGAGAGGRVALYYNSSVPGNGALNLNFQAFGGIQAGNDIQPSRGGAGTVYLEETNADLAGRGDLVIANNNVITRKECLFPAAMTVGNITIKDGAWVLASTFTAIGNMTLQNNGAINHSFSDTATIHRFDITVNGNTSIDATSSIISDGRGLPAGRTSDGGTGQTNISGVNNGDRSGGSHGGIGGKQDNGGGDLAPAVYDNVLQPNQPGSGGGGNGGGVGGGVIKLTTGGLTVNGTISANGAVGGRAGGAGGSVWITSTAGISGNGTIRANGANATFDGNNNGSGGGGLVAFYYNGAFLGNSYPTYNFQAYGAIQSGNNIEPSRSSAGIVVIRDTAQTNPDLVIDNNNNDASRLTPYFRSGQATTATVRNITADHFGKLSIASPGTSFTVTGTISQLNGGTVTNSIGGGFSSPAISITTLALQGGIVGVAYNQTIQSAGGFGPHTFVCRSGGLTVVCTTVLPPGLNMSSAGAITGTPTTTGSYPFTVRATEASPGTGFDEESYTVFVGNAPTAPTNLFSNNTNAQVGNVNPTGIDASPVFSAIYNDPDAAETATKYRIQVASDVGFTTLLWDSNSAGTALSTACNQGTRCENIAYGGSALSLNGTTYYWRIKYWDNNNLEGAFSAGTDTFVTDRTPTAPTSLFSNDGPAQSGLTNPIGVLAGRPNFSAIYNDPDLTDIANKYRIQVDNNSNFSSPVWDSGAAGTSMANCNQGSRCADVVFGAVDELARDETTYFWRIKFWDTAGVESPWSEDPTATNKFTMGINSSNIQQQQVVVQNTVPNTPRAGGVEVLSSTTLRYSWVDLSNNETGFRLLDAEGTIIKQVDAGVTSAQESGLSANTSVSGRKVVAFNSAGVSSPSEVFATAVTAMPVVRPVLVRRGSNSVTFTVTPAPDQAT